MATKKGLEPSTSSVTGWRTNQLYYRATFVNGNNRARTCDPLLVRQMLSQLSYAPTFAAFCCRFPRAHHRGDKRYNTLYRAFCQYLFSKKFRFFPRRQWLHVWRGRALSLDAEECSFQGSAA